MINLIRTLSRNRIALVLVSALPIPASSWVVARSVAESGLVVPRSAFTIVGTVRDAATKAPLEAVQVILGVSPASNVSAQTGADGAYKLLVTTAERGSTISLRIRRIGYKAHTETVVLKSDTVRVDAALDAAPMMLDAITLVGASPIEKRRVSVSTTMIASSEAVAGTMPTIAAKAAGAKIETAAPSTTPVTAIAQPAVAASNIQLRGIGSPPSPSARERKSSTASAPITADRRGGGVPDREQYDRIEDNPFLSVNGNALSTFSIDVDRASYANMRRFLNDGQQPPADAIRIEELINYFPYALEQPRGKDPIAITTEIAPAPWQGKHQLVRIALQARKIDVQNLPANNLVFLIDVSGSMSSPDKLPLVKQSLRLLVDQLREQDRVALVVYAGSAGLVLPSTSGADKPAIQQAIDRLEAGGSTAGGAGITLAYRIARENFNREGNNRVILATDGDFNVGASSDAEMERLIEEKRSEGTYLTVLGFGRGNIQDAKMEKLAKKGNGNYAYVDNLDEARKTLVREMGATLVTVANDVKLQIEFNPGTVRAYRLIGYEDRLLRNEDFTDDKKDAGDIGAGHTVTALYEIVPVGVEGTVKIRETDGLRYVTNTNERTPRAGSEMLFVKLRYKQPGDSTSRLMTHPVRLVLADRSTSDDFRFAASVASFGMLLRGSEYKGTATGYDVLNMARQALGNDPGQYRAEFVRLVERWQGTNRVASERN